MLYHFSKNVAPMVHASIVHASMVRVGSIGNRQADSLCGSKNAILMKVETLKLKAFARFVVGFVESEGEKGQLFAGLWNMRKNFIGTKAAMNDKVKNAKGGRGEALGALRPHLISNVFGLVFWVLWFWSLALAV